MDALEDSLKRLGFSDKEIDVYITVQEHGRITPADISEITDIKRSTVYAIARELVKKQVVYQDRGANNQALVALPPADLHNLVKEKEKELKVTEALVVTAASALDKLAKKAQYAIPKINFISEEGLENFMANSIDRWQQDTLSVTDTEWGFQDPSFVEHYQKSIDMWWDQPESQNISVKLLTSEGAFEKAYQTKGHKNRHIKYWDKATSFSSTIWVFGTSYVMCQTHKRPHYLIEISDALLTHNLRELFKGIWEEVE